MSWPIPAVSNVILNRQHQVLLCRDGGGWKLPSAKFPGGGTWRDAAIGSVRETTGLVTTAPKLVGLYTGEPEGWVVASFLIIEFTGEAASGHWFDARALPESLGGADRARVADALQFQGEVFLR